MLYLDKIKEVLKISQISYNQSIHYLNFQDLLQMNLDDTTEVSRTLIHLKQAIVT